MAARYAKPAEMAQEVYEGIVVAQRLRDELGLADSDPVGCVVDLAERRLAVEVVIAPLGGNVSGFYLPVEPTPIVVVEQTHPVQRQRFTIAHEVGHHALGHAAAPRIHGESTTPNDATANGGPARTGDATSARVPDAPLGTQEAPATVDSAHDAQHYIPRRAPNAEERAANAFAGELLIPERGAKQLLPRWAGEPPLDLAVRLSSHYGVSALSALVKLQTLGTLDWSGAQALRRQLADGEHYARYAALELPPLDDQLQRHADAGGGPRCSPRARREVAALRAEFDALA